MNWIDMEVIDIYENKSGLSGIDYSYQVWPPKTTWETDGSNAFAITLNLGKIAIIGMDLVAESGKGGKKMISGYADSGEAWVVDANVNGVVMTSPPLGKFSACKDSSIAI